MKYELFTDNSTTFLYLKSFPFVISGIEVILNVIIHHGLVSYVFLTLDSVILSVVNNRPYINFIFMRLGCKNSSP